MAQLEIKKMKQGMSYSCKEKTIILNVFKYFRIQFPEKCVTDIVRRTSKATGCSEKSIFQFRKEEASATGFREPSKTKIRKNININSRDIKYDNNVRQSIRNIIYDLKYRNIVPSLNTILKHVNADDQIPNFSLMTLRRLMFDMGFYYEKNGNKSVLAEKSVGIKENATFKPEHKQNIQTSHQNSNELLNMTNSHKPVLPSVNHNICNIQINHHQNINEQQTQRALPVHMPIHDSHMMSTVHVPPHHNMPMMLNHRIDLMPPSTQPIGAPLTDSHVKREVPPWMHSYNIIKQH